MLEALQGVLPAVSLEAGSQQTLKRHESLWVMSESSLSRDRSQATAQSLCVIGATLSRRCSSFRRTEGRSQQWQL